MLQSVVLHVQSVATLTMLSELSQYIPYMAALYYCATGPALLFLSEPLNSPSQHACACLLRTRSGLGNLRDSPILSGF